MPAAGAAAGASFPVEMLGEDHKSGHRVLVGILSPAYRLLVAPLYFLLISIPLIFLLVCLFHLRPEK